MSYGICVIDVETCKSDQEVGGFENARDMGCSVAVVYIPAFRSYKHYLGDKPEQMKELFEDLSLANVVVGFNLYRFDYSVLEPYASRNAFELTRLPTFDMMYHIHNKVKRRVSLDTLASYNLNERKTGDGLYAIELYRTGQIEKLIRYCQDDVWLTRQIFIEAYNRGGLQIADIHRTNAIVDTDSWKPEIHRLNRSNVLKV